jgi:hypothetical protein
MLDKLLTGRAQEEEADGTKTGPVSLNAGHRACSKLVPTQRYPVSGIILGRWEDGRRLAYQWPPLTGWLLRGGHSCAPCQRKQATLIFPPV